MATPDPDLSCSDEPEAARVSAVLRRWLRGSEGQHGRRGFAGSRSRV